MRRELRNARATVRFLNTRLCDESTQKRRQRLLHSRYNYGLFALPAGRRGIAPNAQTFAPRHEVRRWREVRIYPAIPLFLSPYRQGSCRRLFLNERSRASDRCPFSPTPPTMRVRPLDRPPVCSRRSYNVELNDEPKPEESLKPGEGGGARRNKG